MPTVNWKTQLIETPGRPDREGFALVTTLLIVLVLSVLAVGVVWVANSEKKVSFAESVHISSVFAADAGGEAGINFIRVSDAPPRILDFNNNRVKSTGQTNLQGSQNYEYDCNYVRKRPKPGWGVEYVDYDYRIEAQGTSAQNGQSGVGVVVSRLYKEGY